MRGAVETGPGGTAISIPAGGTLREGLGVPGPGGGMAGGGLGAASSSASTGQTNKALAFHPRSWTTDPDDTVVQLELEAARKLISGLEPRRNRIGLVSYAERGRTRAAVGTPADALNALDRIRANAGSSGQNVSAGLRQARLLFSKLDDGDARERRRAVLLLTDGRATHPADQHIAKLNSMYEADSLADRGIDLYVFAIGSIGVDEAAFLLELAGAGRGRVFRLLDPRRLLEDMPPLALAPRWLDIVNATTATSARGVRAGSDGRFDAFVPLAPGTNRIRVIAELADGRLQRWEKDVEYRPPADETDAHRRAAEAVLAEIEARAADPGPPVETPVAPAPAAGPEAAAPAP
jgi:hypothetical protein